MKTCSIRRAQPRSNTEGLFCVIDEPQATHAFVLCGDVLCSCCLPLHTFQKSQFWPIVKFASKSMHQFINGYTTYLNCPAVGTFGIVSTIEIHIICSTIDMFNIEHNLCSDMSMWSI